MLFCQIYCGISTPGNNIIKLKETNLTGVALDKKQTNKQTNKPAAQLGRCLLLDNIIIFGLI